MYTTGLGTVQGMEVQGVIFDRKPREDTKNSAALGQTAKGMFGCLLGEALTFPLSLHQSYSLRN